MEHILDFSGLTYLWGKIKSLLATGLSEKADKTTFEWNKELSNGSGAKVCLGKFFMYDSNVTIKVSLTTLATYNATIVLASQNLNRADKEGSIRANVYGDSNNLITPLLSIFRPNPSTANGSVEVYANLPGFSKCLVHVQGVRLETATEDGVQHVGAYDILSKVSTIPTEISGKTLLTNDGTAGNNKVCNLLKANYYSKIYNGTSSQFLKADGSVDGTSYGTYSKPSTGIPKSDLANDVQTSLGKADTALQSFTESDPTVPAWAKQSTKPSYTAAEVGALPDSTTIPTKVSELTNDSGFTTNTGTITGITMNGASKGTSGVVNLGTVLTEHQSLAGKQDVISDLATIRSGASAGATAYQKPSTGIPKTDLASAVQTSLGKADTALQSHQDISGKADVAALAGYTPTANFATINGASITGGGDIQILAAEGQTITIDATPTSGSSNAVSSGGVYDAIEGGFYY